MPHTMTIPANYREPWRCSCGETFSISIHAIGHLAEEAKKETRKERDAKAGYRVNQEADRLAFLSDWKTTWDCAHAWRLTKKGAKNWLEGRVGDLVEERCVAGVREWRRKP